MGRGRIWMSLKRDMDEFGEGELGSEMGKDFLW
jgi:hypothetical protein